MVVEALVVVVAGSLLTLVEVLLDDVSASAVIDLFDVSDIFLQVSATWKKNSWIFLGRP